MLFNFNINFNDLILSHPVWLAAASLASTDLKRHCLCSRKHIQKHPLTALFTSSKKMTSRCIHTMENDYRNGEHLLSAVFMPRSDTIPVSAHWVPTVRHRENDCTIAAWAIRVRWSPGWHHKAELSQDTRILYCTMPFFKPQKQNKTTLFGDIEIYGKTTVKKNKQENSGCGTFGGHKVPSARPHWSSVSYSCPGPGASWAARRRLTDGHSSLTTILNLVSVHM